MKMLRMIPTIAIAVLDDNNSDDNNNDSDDNDDDNDVINEEGMNVHFDAIDARLTNV